jgi:hypothetical protein
MSMSVIAMSSSRRDNSKKRFAAFSPGRLVAAERPGLDPQLGSGAGDLPGHWYPAGRAPRRPRVRELELLAPRHRRHVPEVRRPGE